MKESKITKEEAEKAVYTLLLFIGENPEREGLKDTPKRVVKSLLEMTCGYNQDPKEILSTQFEPENYDEMIVLRDIEFKSLCEHHKLPFSGVATVGYIPSKKIVGLSKLARLVDCFANRLQVQERLTHQIAHALEEHLEPIGTGVLVKAHHSCMSCRGIKKSGATMITSSLTGVMRKDPACRHEFLSCIK
jgi:GTP cyclohydrolase I